MFNKQAMEKNEREEKAPHWESKLYIYTFDKKQRNVQGISTIVIIMKWKCGTPLLRR